MGVGGLLLLAYFLWGNGFGLRSSTTDGPAVLAQGPIDLWDAYERAEEAVRAESEDARLVSASAQWQQVSEEALVEGADDWSFVFYSPGESSVFDVVVSGETAQVVNQTQVWVAPQVLDEGGWRTGPSDPLLAFLAYGGRVYLEEHPRAVVDLHLAKDDDADSSWAVVALDTSDQSVFSLLVDAETGQVTPVAP
jgi:hypothetical protein